MIWFWLAISVAVIWSVANLIDKHIVTDLIKEPLAILMLVPVFSLSFAAVLYFMNTAPISKILFFPFLLGFLNTVGYLAYYKAMKVEEATRVLSLTYTLPIFVLIYATIFLGETFSPLQYSGIFLITIGAVAIGLRRVEKVLKASPAAILAIGSAVLWGGIDTGLKWSVGNIPLLQSVMAIFLGYGVSSGLFWVLKRNRKLFFKNVKFGKPVLVLAVSGLLWVAGWAVYIYSMTLAPVSLVAALISTQPLFVLFFATIITLFAPQILKEEIGKGPLAVKLVSIILIITGAVLIG